MAQNTLLRALRISQNGPKGTVFTAYGNRVKQLTAGDNPIAEVVTEKQLAEEKAKPAAKPAAKPSKKGGPKPKDATQHDDDEV